MLSGFARSLRVFSAPAWKESASICEMLAILDLNGHWNTTIIRHSSRSTFGSRSAMLRLVVLQRWQVFPMFLHNRGLVVVLGRVNVIVLLVLLLLKKLLLLLKLLLLKLLLSVGVYLLLNVHVVFRRSSFLLAGLNQ